MSGERYTIDANILFYALDDRADEKREVARALLRAVLQNRCPIAVQTLGETYNAMSKRRPALTAEVKAILSHLTSIIEVVTADPADFLEAMRLREKRQVQFWDAMLWATAKRHRCTTILTEDLHDRPVSEGMRYLNPFESPSDPDLPLFLPS